MTTTSTIARTGLAGLATALLLSTLPAQAQEGVAIKNLLGSMGVIPPEKDPIRYRERAPLVLPPKMGLREPMAPGKTASADPAWPQDPDVMSKRQVLDEQRRPVTESEIRRMSERNTRLTAEEMRTGRSLTTDTTPDPKLHRGDSARDLLVLSPDELASKKKVDDPALLVDGEPTRRTLAEPPTGLRKPVNGRRLEASAATPRIDQQERDANPMTWLTRKFSGSGDEE